VSFLGEFEIKIDAKGRAKLPSALIRQFGEGQSMRFVVNRGFENCLVLYTKEQWKVEEQKLSALNPYNKKHRQFLRGFYNGATELVADASDRILLPKQLMKYAGIEKEIVLFAHLDKIEIWDKSSYEDLISFDSDEYANLADEVMNFSNSAKDE